MTLNIFEQASRQKFRFATTRGNISTEDLWDLSLEDLDTIAKNLNKLVKASTEESFIKKTNAGNKKATIQLEVVVSIINTKLEEQESRKLATERKAKRAQIIEIMSKKQDNALSRKSIAALQAELDKLDDGEEEEA